MVTTSQKKHETQISAQFRSLSLSLSIFRFHPAVDLELDLPAGVHKWALAEQLFRVVS